MNLRKPDAVYSLLCNTVSHIILCYVYKYQVNAVTALFFFNAATALFEVNAATALFVFCLFPTSLLPTSLLPLTYRGLEVKGGDRRMVASLFHPQLRAVAVFRLKRLAQERIERFQKVAGCERHGGDEACHHVS